MTDFWTTKCERCPQALDQLEELAQTAAAASNNNNNKELNFVSICCGGGGGGDGAREILEEPDRQPRWHHLSHYYMSYHDKETAKQVLGFQTVPFYVIVQPDGTIVHKGSKLPQLLVTRNDHPHEEKTETKQEEEEKEERVFEMDDDF